MQQQPPRPRVLVIDEERRTLRLAQAFLSREYDVTACEDPREALRILEQDPFHVLVMSHNLRTMDIFTLAREARESQPHLSCLVISGSARTHDPEMQSHRIACMISPYHPATLLEIMERLVSQGEQAAETMYADRESEDATDNSEATA